MNGIKNKYHTFGLWLAVIAACGYSFKAILIKLAYAIPQTTPIDAITLLTLRMLFALPFFLFFSRTSRRGVAPIGLRDGGLIIIFGLLGYYAASIFDFIGLQYISSGLERVILFAYPILTLIFEALYNKRTIRKEEWLAVVICYLGICLVFFHDLGGTELQTDIWLGGSLILLSATCYAFYLVGASRMITRLGSKRFASAALVVASSATGAHFASAHSLGDLIQPLNIYLLAFVMGLFCTVVPAFALAAAIHRVGSSTAALIGCLGPILTIALGWQILNEPVSFQQLIGAALVIIAIVLISQKSRQNASTQGSNPAEPKTAKKIESRASVR